MFVTNILLLLHTLSKWYHKYLTVNKISKFQIHKNLSLINVDSTYYEIITKLSLNVTDTNGSVRYLVLIQTCRPFTKVYQRENRLNRLSMITKRMYETKEGLPTIFAVGITVRAETKNCTFFHPEGINTVEPLTRRNYVYNTQSLNYILIG